MTDRVTIMMAARNAAATIERAVRSCAGETRVPILLINDHSTDDTVAVATAAADGRLRVIDAPDPGGVALARQAGLDAVETEFATWLDADDEWVPGRMPEMITALESGADVAVDAFDLFDGATGAWLRTLTAPAFLQSPGGAVRLFERNWLPGDSPVGFRVSTFRDAGGYDPAVYGPESYDVLLRAIARGARFGWSDRVGYRIYAYPGSVSRHIARQRAAVASALRKHSYASIAALYRDAGHNARVTAWAMVSVALFRGELREALAFLESASPAGMDPREVLEPDGPWPFAEGWRRAFTRGVLLLLLGGHDREALVALEEAERIEQTAEGANNLGVALARAGRLDEARDAWRRAEERFPGYADARSNAAADVPTAVTTHPLRRLAARNDYRAG